MAIPKGPALEYMRGDTGPITLRFKDGDRNFNFSNWVSIELTVDTLEDPTDALTNVITLNGDFDADRESGLVGFRPANQAASDGLTPATGLFYDVQGIDGNGYKTTLLKGGDFTIKQDINKG